jgi:Domain of unknown function (DUF4286)
MFIYNVTTKVAHNIHTDWLYWMKNEHIPAVMASNCFTSFSFVRLLEIEEDEGPTYAIQYHIESKADYNRYIELHAPALRQETITRWGNQIMAFRSLMQHVD